MPESNLPVLQALLAPQISIVQAMFGGLVLVLLNAVGAIVVLFWKKPAAEAMDAALGFAAGIMLTASYTSLILPGSSYAGVGPVIIGMLIGAFALRCADRFVPHLHAATGREGPATTLIKTGWLFTFAIAIHNVPEGLAVGAGFGSGDLENAVTLMLAIGIQNIPEGLAVAAAALSLGIAEASPACLLAIAVGAVELPFALLGAWLVDVFDSLVPYAMGFAAGAMIYVISAEVIPETHRKGHERFATAGLVIGVATMLYLDVALG